MGAKKALFSFLDTQREKKVTGESKREGEREKERLKAKNIYIYSTRGEGRKSKAAKGEERWKEARKLLFSFGVAFVNFRFRQKKIFVQSMKAKEERKKAQREVRERERVKSIAFFCNKNGIFALFRSPFCS